MPYMIDRRTAYNSFQPNEIRVMEQFKDVCRDYIVYTLRQYDMISRYRKR